MKRKNIKSLLLTAALGLGMGLSATSMAWSECDEIRYQCLAGGGSLDECFDKYYACQGYL